MKSTVILGPAVLVMAACAPVPPKLYPTPEAAPIQASFEDSWDAVIDYFAKTLIPIATIEKASGLIVTDAFTVGTLSGDADCGRDWLGNPFAPSLVRHNVRVKGDSAGSQVRITTIFASAGPYRCTSKGTYETWLLSDLKGEAERSHANRERSSSGRPAISQPPTARPRADTSRGTGVQPSSPSDTLFVGSRVDMVYFRRGCLAAEDIAPQNRRYFRTEQDAIAAAYRRSRVPGC